MKAIKGLVALALAFQAGTACRRTTSDSSAIQAINTRPATSTEFIAILKLRQPALLTTARREQGRTVVDPVTRDRILAEQAEVERSLTALDSSVRIIYRYRFVLNGLAISAPSRLREQIGALGQISYVEVPSVIAPPAPASRTEFAGAVDPISERNSTAFIGALRAHRELTVERNGQSVPVDGTGTRVGIIDTGIDYTHKMFGGEGTVEAYRANNPTMVEPGSFPTAKVVGGVDLVGSTYNGASPRFADHIPTPDADPLDEQEHGSHVAATVAGVGDDVNTYSGVAPGAQLYAIKVFGPGSTSDFVVIAAMEFSADPNNDLDPADQLDVVNLSLGSSYGMPQILYNEAVRNLVAGGTVAAISAGNSGAAPYIVGAPSTADDALSVAASVDDMYHNWKFEALKVYFATGEPVLEAKIESVISQPTSEVGELRGHLVYIGLADRDLTPAEIAAVRGNIALIDRGRVSFGEKLRRAAAAGAIGIVVANNQPGAPIRMGGDDGTTVPIPAVMITLDLGTRVKLALEQHQVVDLQFNSPEYIENPELIDTLTDFSSRGPRSLDAAIKPEVSAPGANILSAKMGGGDAGIMMSGTSMAAPHISGASALVRQARPELSGLEIKALLMNTAVSIRDAAGTMYPVSAQGSGRVRVFEAITSPVVASTPALSLGEIVIGQTRNMRRNLVLRATKGRTEHVQLQYSGTDGLAVTLDSTELDLPATGAPVTVPVRLALSAPPATAVAHQVEGTISITVTGAPTLRVPIMGVVKRLSEIHATMLDGGTPGDPAAPARVHLENRGPTGGAAILFNLLGVDERQARLRGGAPRGSLCDLQSAGYRVLDLPTEDGQTVKVLQIAAKLYNPMTTWHACELSVQFDGDGDGIADQELLGTDASSYTSQAPTNTFASVLTDASALRTIRREYDETFDPNAPGRGGPDYTAAIGDVQGLAVFEHSTIMVLSVDLAKVGLGRDGKLHLKLAALAMSEAPNADDYLGTQAEWLSVPVAATTLFPPVVELEASQSTDISIARGSDAQPVVIYLPFNRSNMSLVHEDQQSIILR